MKAREAIRLLGVAGILAGGLVPASAQEAPGAPVGPCSPFAAEDGDIPSELPGCARRLGPRPGTLADELEFRQGLRGRAPAGDVEEDADDPVRRRSAPRRRRPPTP